MRRPPEPPQIVVQRLAAAYNKQDIEGVSACLAANCVVAAFAGATEMVGLPALRTRYEAHFEEKPKPRLSIMGRMALGDIVIQHETISRGLGNAERQIAIYTVIGDRIARIDLIR